MASDLEIVDGHMHLWTPQTHPWVEKVKDGGHPAGKFEKVVTYTLKEYLADVSGYNITQSVHVEAGWPGDPVGETRWLDEIADSNPKGVPHAIVGHADLSADNLEDILKRHCESKRMRGIRHILNYHPTKPEFSEQAHDNFLTDPKWLAGVGLLEKYRLSFEFQVLPVQMQRTADVVKKFPGVMFMIDHCGVPYERDEATMAVWREGLTALAQYPNTYCKISGFFATNPKWNTPELASVIIPCIEIFGVDRCVFASNFPVDRINGTFDQMMKELLEILKGYSNEDKKKIFGENAKKFYRL